MKVQPITNQSGVVDAYAFQCPGCIVYAAAHPIPPFGTPELMKSCEELRVQHVIQTRPDGWSFNGDVNRPTFMPSLMVYRHVRKDGFVYQPQCHLNVRDGRIEFLSDCEHPLAGQTIELPDIEPAA